MVSYQLSMFNSLLVLIFGSLLGSVYVAVEYMLGKLAPGLRLEMSAIMNMKSLIAGMALASLTIIAFSFISPLLEDPVIKDISLAISQLKEADAELLRVLSIAYAFSQDLSAFSWGFSISAYFVKAGTNIPGRLAHLGVAANLIIQLISSLISSVVLLQAFFEFLKFTLWAALNYFFPFSVFVRLMPPFKRLGSTLMAISIGLIFVFPLTLWFSVKLGSLLLFPSGSIDEMVKTIKSRADIWDNSHLFTVFSIWRYSIGTLLEAAWVAGVMSAIFAQPGAVGSTFAVDVFGIPVPIIPGPVWLQTVYLAYRAADSVMKLALGTTTGAFPKLSAILNNHILPTASLIGIQSMYLFFISILSVISTLVAIRSISLLLGGDYFLYGIQSRVT